MIILLALPQPGGPQHWYWQSVFLVSTFHFYEWTLYGGLRREDIPDLPSMRSLPGRYSPQTIKCRTRPTLLDHNAARQVGITLHESISAKEGKESGITSQWLEEYNSRKSLCITGVTNLHQLRSQDVFDETSSFPNLSCESFVHHFEILVKVP
ncbi:hypothetical protein EYZ11_004213 [Aspergillus tanneri]|uniref:Uncharacterized protein n=1 Tax=Aspergillus tanneri TaxID=1220188 RepID=A0A4S3JNF9_9EURO|nr:hypothetical protein EYZ11_004213 [Aspergillus tanneri]